jgi:cob(I)alamin adenosyltransferase
MKIYTKTGDTGNSGLFGGRRVPKNDARLEAYGTLDELNAQLGLLLCEKVAPQTRATVVWLQNTLFIAGADLATPFSVEEKTGKAQRISDEHIAKAETFIDAYEAELPELRNFILPGGTRAAALLHIARTVCRRAERVIVCAQQKDEINEKLLIFVNRISDLLFVLSRYENHSSGIADTKWE